jgi:hypothetical protein
MLLSLPLNASIEGRLPVMSAFFIGIILARESICRDAARRLTYILGGIGHRAGNEKAG